MKTPSLSPPSWTVAFFVFAGGGLLCWHLYRTWRAQEQARDLQDQTLVEERMRSPGNFYSAEEAKRALGL